MSCPNSEYNENFWKLMLNRMAISYHKYGPLKEAFPHKVDALQSIKDRLREYEKTGNTEYLIDAANFAMIEFMRPSHQDAHFEATDSDRSPGRRWYDKRHATCMSNDETNF